jgi:succinate dehydrogenase / fumarate reductase cytochrome b subunit
MKTRTTIGAKTVMAVTGVFLLLFVLGHMVGNLQYFAGKETLNAYAEMLQGLGPLLWIIRLSLLAIFLAHVISAMTVVRRNRAARPVAYACKENLTSTFASRTMLMSGLIVGAFVIYHLLHFTVVLDANLAAIKHPEGGALDVYGMVTAAFSHGPTTLIYVMANILLALHCSHGVQSALQTFGLRSEKCAACQRLTSHAIGALILLGNLAVPLSIHFCNCRA